MNAQNIQPDYKRLLATIRRQEPDRVPLAELGIDRPIKEGFLGRPVRDIRDEVEFWATAGYDYVYLRPNYEYLGAPAIVASGTTMAWDASALDHEAETISTTQAGPVQTLADLDTYPWPDPQTVDCSDLEEAAGLLPAGMGIISGVGGIFTRTWMILGYEHFCYSLADAPELVARVFERVGRTQCEVLRRVVRMPGVFAIWYGDDLAYTEGLLASLWQILDDLVALGLDALHPIEPKAMDINAVKGRYGDRLALFGNIDLSYTLTRGTPAEVRAEVRQRIRDLAPGGGYAVGSSNSVTHYVPLENFDAMREATFEYGVYPIRL
jgi:uroporphyrinogen decarboxylase